MEYFLFAAIVLIVMFAWFEIDELRQTTYYPDYRMYAWLRIIPHVIAVVSLGFNIFFLAPQ